MEHGLELTSRAETSHFWFRGFRRFVSSALQDVTAGRSSLRLIDCGCGTGFNLSLLEPYGEVAGFDLTPGGVARAVATGHPAVIGDITAIPFGSGRFDVATSFDVLQCVPDDKQAVREMARLVRPGGAIVLTLAAFDFLRGEHAIYWSESRRYTPSRAKQLVEDAGLRVERLSFMFASIFPLFVVSRLWQRAMLPFRKSVRGDVDIRVPSPLVNGVLTKVVEAEARLARSLPMPIGSSILVVARKP